MTHTIEGIEKRKKTMLKKYGKLTWNSGLNYNSSKSVRKYTDKIKGRHLSPKTEFKKGHKTTKLVRKKIGKAHKGRRVSIKTEFKKGEYSGKNNINWVDIPKKLLIELYLKKRKSIGEISKELGRDKGTITRKLNLYKIKIRNNRESLKAKFENEDFKMKAIKTAIKNTQVRPTSYEKRISNLCIEYNLPFIYTGDGAFLIGYKNPDFINEKRKMAIEVYHNYFKIRDFGSCENYERQRREYFSKYGWDVIFIRTEHMESKEWKKICLSKIDLTIKFL